MLTLFKITCFRKCKVATVVFFAYSLGVYKDGSKTQNFMGISDAMEM